MSPDYEEEGTMIDPVAISWLVQSMSWFGVILATGSVSIITRSRVGVVGTVVFALLILG